MKSISLHRAVLLLVLVCVAPAKALAQPAPKAPPDSWLAEGVFPPFLPHTNHWSVSQSGTLTNQALVGKLRVYWHPQTGHEASAARLWFSTDSPGRWQARDWKSQPMEKRGERWETAMPVQNVDVPMVYFVEATGASRNHTTAMRVCVPRATGLEEPSRIFWPFLEGFEEELGSWRTVTDEPVFVPVEKGTVVKNGHAALRLTIPPGKRSVTVATTRVRGWQLNQNFASGIRLWVRLTSGTAKLRCTLHAHAYSPEQVISPYPEEPTVGTEWRAVDLVLNRFPRFPVSETDLLSIELVGNGPLECFIDDVQLLGRWPTVD